MNIALSKPARTCIYFVCIGGLLVFNSSLVMLIWNNVAAHHTSDPRHISFLEGAGITAFGYVIVFSLKYGLQGTLPKKKLWGHSTISETRQPLPDNLRDTIEKPVGAETCVKSLTQEQKLALKQELLNSCGCKETTVKS